MAAQAFEGIHRTRLRLGSSENVRNPASERKLLAFLNFFDVIFQTVESSA